MDFTQTKSNNNYLPFFTATPVYVICSEKDGGNRNWCTEPVESGYAPVCFLSRVEAMIESSRLVLRHRQFYRIVPASELPPEEFRIRDEHGKVSDQQGFAAVFHMGWAACDHRILKRRGVRYGGYRRCSRSAYLSADDPAGFEVSAEILSTYNDFRERAGLFAWQETEEQFRRWDMFRLYRNMQGAIWSLDLAYDPSSKAQQLAMYDPECQQWHFVPLTA
jgi:hypothetical protein